MTEVVDDTAVRSICHGLRDGQLRSVVLCHPVAARVEELGLIAIQAGVTSIWTCRCGPVDLVQQLAKTLDLISLVTAPSVAMSTIWEVGEAHCVVPVAWVCLVEGVRLPNAHLNIRRGPGVPSKLIVTGLAHKEVHLHAKVR